MQNEIIATASIRHGMNANDNYEIVSYVDNTYQAFRNGKVIGPRRSSRPREASVICGFIHKPLGHQPGEVSRVEKLPLVKVLFEDGAAQVFDNANPITSRFPHRNGEKVYVAGTRI